MRGRRRGKPEEGQQKLGKEEGAEVVGGQLQLVAGRGPGQHGGGHGGMDGAPGEGAGT